MEKEPKREFTGWWIPKELKEIEDLSLTAIFLWAEIMALSANDPCFAKNSYFAKSLRITEGSVKNLLKSLKDKGLVEQVGFDGRNRLLKANYPSNQRAEVDKNRGQTSSYDDPRGHHLMTLSTPPTIYNNTIYKTYDNKVAKADVDLFEPDVYDAVRFLFNKYNSYRKNINLEPLPEKAINKNWLMNGKKLISKYGLEKTKQVIEYTYNDPFWSDVVKSPNGIVNNWIRITDKMAKEKFSEDRSEKIVTTNLQWIKSYIESRERMGAMGILKYDNNYAWDQNKEIRWRMDDPQLREKIYKFYENYK